jgi:hypothetical protein
MTETASAPNTPEAITSTSVIAFFAADHAVMVPDGKVYVNGAFFSLLRFPAFPALLPTLGVAAALQLPFHSTMQNHVIRVTLRGPDRQDLPVRVEAQFRAAPTIEAQFGDPGLVPFGVTVTNVEFPFPGVYELVLWFDNEEKASYRINVIQSMAAPNAMPASSPPSG